MSADHPTLAEIGEENVKGYLSREQMRERIRGELTKEIKNPSIWYPLSKKNMEKRDKLTVSLSKKEEK